MSYLDQMRNGAILMTQYEAYARQIGCTVMQDEITCHTAEQALLLDEKWLELTKPASRKALHGETPGKDDKEE